MVVSLVSPLIKAKAWIRGNLMHVTDWQPVSKTFSGASVAIVAI